MAQGPQIAILEFGSQHTLQIGRCLRELGYQSMVVKPKDFEFENGIHHFRAAIGSGGFQSVYEEGTPRLSPTIMPQQNDNPLCYLGICFGMQLSIQQSGGTVARGDPEYAKTTVDINPSILFEGLSSPRQIVWMSHGDRVVNLPPDFEILGMSEGGTIAAVRHKRMPHFGYSFTLR
jgi:GMP synthase (glutamine-hydrolysing)